LVLQAHDNPPGTTIPFRDLDYKKVITWLTRILELDPAGPYPLLAASRLYGEVADPARQRVMLEFVYQQFLLSPDTRWQALAHAATVARHRLQDTELALRYANALREKTSPGGAVPNWARQMEIFLRADLNELEAARVLLGGLLASGEVKSAEELRFLTGRLREIEAGIGAK
jgi:hypothetical protein